MCCRSYTMVMLYIADQEELKSKSWGLCFMNFEGRRKCTGQETFLFPVVWWHLVPSLMTQLSSDWVTSFSLKHSKLLTIIFFFARGWVLARNHNWHCFPHNLCKERQHCLLKAQQNGCRVITSLRQYRVFPLSADWSHSLDMAYSITQTAYASRHFS